VRHVRARQISAGFLGLATSFFFAILAAPLCAQFPIRQLPAQGSGFRAQSPSVGNQVPGAGATLPSAPQSAIRNPQSPAVTPRSAFRSPQFASSPTSSPLPAVARVVVPEKDGISYGSGTLIDARGQFGLVISNWHVVRDAAGPITVEFPDGFKSPAEVVKTDKDWDLAALSIYRPRITPVSITAIAPQPGESLTIAGYGSGDWRMTSGRCTQYLAPGVEFPHEMVELAAEARQGDSGGPILNDRGELAGVLFGSGPGYTSGSYGGRVLKFLATVVPGGAPGNDGLPANNQAVAADRPQARSASEGPGNVPLSTSLHENDPFRSPHDPLTPALKPTIDPLLSPPPPTEVASRFGPAATTPSFSDVDPRVAVSPSRLDLSSTSLPTAPAPLPTSIPAAFDSPLASRLPAATSSGNSDSAPDTQLLAQLWQRYSGPTLFDQAKAVLSLVGALSLVIVFLRFGSQKEREHEEE
jgi:serine protease Do